MHATGDEQTPHQVKVLSNSSEQLIPAVASAATDTSVTTYNTSMRGYPTQRSPHCFSSNDSITPSKTGKSAGLAGVGVRWHSLPRRARVATERVAAPLTAGTARQMMSVRASVRAVRSWWTLG